MCELVSTLSPACFSSPAIAHFECAASCASSVLSHSAAAGDPSDRPRRTPPKSLIRGPCIRLSPSPLERLPLLAQEGKQRQRQTKCERVSVCLYVRIPGGERRLGEGPPFCSWRCKGSCAKKRIHILVHTYISRAPSKGRMRSQPRGPYQEGRGSHTRAPCGAPL